jgi:hypothetical protein
MRAIFGRSAGWPCRFSHFGAAEQVEVAELDLLFKEE